MDPLLSRSADFESFVNGLLLHPAAQQSKRTEGARILCAVVMEHALSIKILMHANAFTSALGLLRLQYEALVRAHWLIFAASDIMVDIHGGIHVISRNKQGYPVILLENVLKNSNQLSGVAGYFWSHQTQNPLIISNAMASFKKYQDCFNYVQ